MARHSHLIVAIVSLMFSIDGSLIQAADPPPAGSASDSVTNSIGMQLKLIPAGEFLMGSIPSDLDKVAAFDPTFKKESGGYARSDERTVRGIRQPVRVRTPQHSGRC